MLKYYESILGRPDKEVKFVDKEGHTVFIYKWRNTKEDVPIYSTNGASKFLTAQEGKRCEFFIGLTPEVDSIAESLAEIALEGIGSNVAPNYGDSITLSEPLWDGTEMRSMLFERGSEIFPPVRIGENHIHFIKLIPLFDNELSFKKKYGREKLWNRFEEKLVPFWKSDRGPFRF